MRWNINNEIDTVTQETNRKKKGKKKKTAEYCHIVVTNSPNNMLQIALSWGGYSSLRLIFSMYFESHKQQSSANKVTILMNWSKFLHEILSSQKGIVFFT